MSFDKSWNYTESHRWKTHYPLANGKQQSPIAIRTENTNPCDLLCDIAFRFAASTTCHVRVNNRTPLITFDANAGHLKYMAQKQIVGLRAMTLHTPSMHTIDGIQYDLEVILYYKLSGPLNPSDSNYIPGGTAVSILFQRGPDYGDQNAFLNAFIHQLPINDSDGQQKDTPINVGPKWTPAALFPEARSFFSYPGSLPFPPAEEEWNWIVMEEVQAIGGSIIDTLQVLFKGNQRPVQPLGSRVVNYNDSTDTPLIISGGASSAELVEPNDAHNKGKLDTNGGSTDEKRRLTLLEMEKERGKSWYKDRKPLFQGIGLSIVLLLVVYAAYKMAKHIIFNDLVNKAIVNNVKPSTASDSSNSSSSSSSSSSKDKTSPIKPSTSPPPSSINRQPTTTNIRQPTASTSQPPISNIRQPIANTSQIPTTNTTTSIVQPPTASNKQPSARYNTQSIASPTPTNNTSRSGMLR